MNAKRIFCFWEPQGAMPAYLRVCMRTWELNIPDYEIIFLNYSNLDRYIKKGTYDVSALRKFHLQVQKDAILAAVLNEHGGVFMDVDTIVTRDISPIVRKLSRAEVVTFNVNLGFVAARPNSRMLTRWTREAQARLARLGQNKNGDVPPGWDYLGNGVLADVMADMVSASSIGRAYENLQRRQPSWPVWVRAAWRRFCDPIWARRRGIFFRVGYKKYLTMLDRRRHGFIVEAAFYGKTNLRSAEQYRKFWFEEKLGVEKVFRGRQRLIGLHNSWTPEWYKALSEKEVLAHDCLLSRTLRHILAR